MKIVNRSFRYLGHGDTSAVLRVSIDANARDRKSAPLPADIDLFPSRCDCSHCANDWDCCGNIISAGTKIKFRKGGFVVIQHLTRNV